MAAPLNNFKKDYRTRFCYGGRRKIDIQPGQNVLKLVQDCFDNCGSDLTINSPCATCCSTPVERNERRTWVENQGSDVRTPCKLKVILAKPQPDLIKPKTGLTNSVKIACNSAESLSASPLKTVSSRGYSHESPLKPAIPDDVVVSKKTKSPVPKGVLDLLSDVEGLLTVPATSSDLEDDHGSVEAPLLIEKVESSPVKKLRFDAQDTPAAVKSRVEAGSVEGSQNGRDERAVLTQQRKRAAASSVRKEKPFYSFVFSAVATGTRARRFSTSASPPSTPPANDQDIENECEFVIDESDSESHSWFSIPRKNKTPKPDGSATSVSKFQPSENKTECKKGKNTKAEVKALTKEKVDDGSVSVRDSRGTSESDPVPDSEEKALKSQRQNSAHRGKTKKNALSQGSHNRKKGTSWKLRDEELMLPQPELEKEDEELVLPQPELEKEDEELMLPQPELEKEDEELMLPQPELKKKPPGTEQGKTRVTPSKDSPVPSAGHQQKQPASPKKNCKSSKNLQSSSKSSLHSVHKKQTSKQKPPKDAVAKRLAKSPRKKLAKSGKKNSSKKHQLQKEESSDSEPGEELEREPVKSNEVFTIPLNQKLQTFEIQKSTEKPENVVHALKSLGSENNETLKALLQQLLDSLKKSEKKQSLVKSSGKTKKKSEKKQSSVKSSGEMPKKIRGRTSKDICSDPENTELQSECDSSPEQDTARRKQKLPDVKIKRNKRKRDTQHGQLEVPLATEKAMDVDSGPVVEYGDEFASRSKSCEQDNTSSDKSEEFSNELRSLFSDNIPRHKIVMPSDTPGVRRTKRIRLKPLEYWRGERANYMMMPSEGFVVSGIPSPEAEPHRKVKQRSNHKQETGNEILESPSHTLADASKPTVVLDPVTSEEVLLECINTDSTHSCFFKDEAVEIHKNLNTSAFAMGRLILKPLKEKGQQFVHMDTVAFYVIHGKVIVTLHKTSYCLTTGDFFYVPEGNEYNIRNVLNKESVLLFTQLKKEDSRTFFSEA